MAGDDDGMLMTRSFNITGKTTEQNLIVRSNKSVSSVTNNTRSSAVAERSPDASFH